MIGRHFGRVVHVPGALTADLAITISVPVDCRLARVSAVAGNAQDAEIQIGVNDDADNILLFVDVGDSHAPAVYKGPWAASNPLGLLKQGDLLKVVVDHDGDGGDAASNLTIDLDFLEG